MTDNIVRIGIVGAGATTTERQIPYFQSIEGVEIVAVSNRSRESGARVAQQFNIPRVCDSWGEVVSSAEINAVYIGTWPYLHHPVTMEALGNGKHVLTQARMAMNSQEAREMLEASQRHPHLVAQVFPASRSFGVDHIIKRLIGDGYLGEVLSVDLAENSGFLGKSALHTWRNDRELSGYNIMSLGYWVEIMMRWLGSASSVSAVTKTNAPTRYDVAGQPRVTDIPDHVDVISEFLCGAVAHIRISEAGGLGPSGQARIFGSEGTLIVDLETMTIWGGRDGDSKLSEIEIPDDSDEFVRCSSEEEFVNAIRGTGDVRFTTFEDGVRYMEFTEAVTLSAETGCMVNLPLKQL